MSTIGERIKEIRKSLKINQTKFGEEIGLAPNTIANYECGRREVTEQSIKSICREFNVNYTWLVYGKGEMFSENINLLGKLDRALANENETTIAVFKAFAELSEEEWTVVGNIIDKIQKNKADTN